ncbi:hypothetical protein RSJ21_11310 [Clostridium botulinum]|nr:hypothetical protein RSJ22_11080 [Clostridium botulinum]AUN25799.1 hypothetical protein RSJ21_11310 [Clostridium botulinum]QDY21424.1 hypothetical protein CGQ39_10845 [Clostridium botulinum]
MALLRGIGNNVDISCFELSPMKIEDNILSFVLTLKDRYKRVYISILLGYNIIKVSFIRLLRNMLNH